MNRTMLSIHPTFRENILRVWLIRCDECGEFAPCEYDHPDDAVEAISLGDLDTHPCVQAHTGGPDNAA